MSASGVQQHALHNNDPVNDPTAQRRQSDVMGNRKSSTLPSIGKTSSSSAVNRHELPDSCRLENVADEHPGGSPVNVDALHHHEQHPVASVACVNGSTDEHQLSLNNLSSSSNVNQGDGYERPDDCNLATSTNGGSTPSDFRRPDSSGEVAASAVEIVDRSFPVAEQIAETCVDDTRNGNSTTVTDCSTGSAVVGGSSESAAAETEGEPSTSADGVTALVVEVTEMKSDLSTSTGGDDAVVEASEDDVFENTSGTTSSTEETTATRSSTSSRLSVKRRPLTRAAAEIIRSPTPISELDEDFGSDGRRQSDDDVIDNRKINGLAGRRYQETDDITSAAITDDVNSTPDVDYNAAKLSDDVTMDGTDGLSTPSSALCSTPATATARFGKSMLGRRMESCLAQVDLERCDPSTCVSLLRLPAMKTYSALSRKLKSCDRKWMEGFLEEGGLDMLLKGVETVSSRRVVLLTDAMLLLECVNCVRCVMNSQIGLDVILQQPNYVQILVGALDMSNVMVKKQVFDLLSALCVSSDEGFDVIMDAVDNYKTTRSMHYRFSFLMSELRSDVCTPAYAVSIIAFINCLIVGHEDLQERIRVRNELIGLNFLEVIDKYRDVNDDELIIQCDVFYDEKQSDEDELATLVQTVGLDLNSHKDVFDVIYERVYNAPQSATLLNILHSLLQIDNQNKNCDLVWNTVDAAVSKAVLVSNEQQAHNFLSSKTNSMSFSTIGTQTDPDVLPPSTSVQKPMAESNPAASADTTSVPPPPPPPPPPMPVALGTFSVPLCPPPPPPPPPPPSAPFMMAESSALFKSPDESLLGCPPPPPPPPPPFSSEIPQPPAPPPLLFAASSCPLPPPPPPPMNAAPPPPPLGLPLPPPLSAGALGAPPPFPVTESPLAKVVGVTLQSANQVMRRAVTMPAPRSKMKTVNWTKLPPSAVSRSDAVWNEVNKMQDPVSVDYATLEQLFSKRTEEPVVAKQPEKKKSTEVNLLDTKRSMNINIFLKQFKMTNEAIVDLIRRGDDAQIGPEKLKGLMKLLPEKDEIESINGYDGDRSKLGNAEKFFASLISLVAYPTRIEAMLIKAEFQANVDALTPRIDAVIDASTGILDSKSFLQFLRVTLQTVNFINAGCYAGNAVGFRLSSLMKLIDTRSNKPRVTLLHYIVDILDSSKEENAFEFVDKLSKPAAVASKQTVEGLHSEVNLLDKGVRNITKQILNIKLADVTQQFSDYFNKASTEVKNLQDRMEQIEQLSHKLAQRFCEDEKTFKVEEFLQTFNSFCELVRQCQKDNENRRIQEEKAAKRKLLEEQKLDHKTKENDKKQTTSPDDECIIDKLLCEIRRGTSLRRRTSNVSRRRSRSSSRGQTPQRELPPSPFKSVGGSSSDASSIVACGGAT